MADFKYAESFLKDSVDKQLHIEFAGGTITNEEIHSENFELTESLCSEEQLRFGGCEASSIKFKISNIFTPLKDKWLTVSETLGGNTDVPFLFGKYKVFSDKPTADRRYRDIVAYDAMYDIITADVTDWFNTILPNTDSTVTLKEFRTSFFAHFGIEQEDVEFVNDSMIVTRTIEPSKLSGKTVATAICEINGCFGHIGRNGKFQYIFLKEMIEGLYPSDTLYPRDDLYPADPLNTETISKKHYISATYEDFITARINKLQIRQEEDDIGCVYGTGDNCYIVQDNFLLYGKSAEELETVAANMYSVISRVWYRPAHVEAKGNPCLEVGTGIKLHTTYEVIYTYILQRTLKGIQALRDTYDAEGAEYQSQDVNSTHEAIIQLKGKTNKLTRTVEETRSEITNIEKGLSTRVNQNAQEIALEAQRASGAEAQLSAKIALNADNITAEIKRASEAEGNLASQISLNAQQILLKVSKGSIISEINQTAESVKIKAQKIDLVGLVEADEFVSKYATLTTLNSVTAALNEAIINRALVTDLNATNAAVSGKLDASEFTADTISAMGITVKAANVTGTLTVNQLDVNGLINDMASKTLQCITFTAQTTRSSHYQLWDGYNYVNLSALLITINGTSYRLMGYKA